MKKLIAMIIIILCLGFTSAFANHPDIIYNGYIETELTYLIVVNQDIYELGDTIKDTNCVIDEITKKWIILLCDDTTIIIHFINPQ